MLNSRAGQTSDCSFPLISVSRKEKINSNETSVNRYTGKATATFGKSPENEFCFLKIPLLFCYPTCLTCREIQLFTCSISSKPHRNRVFCFVFGCSVFDFMIVCVFCCWFSMDPIKCKQRTLPTLTLANA